MTAYEASSDLRAALLIVHAEHLLAGEDSLCLCGWDPPSPWPEGDDVAAPWLVAQFAAHVTDAVLALVSPMLAAQDAEIERLRRKTRIGYEAIEADRADRDRLREGLAAWEGLYRDAIGLPPSEHQARRLEQMAQAVEAGLAERNALRADRDRLQGLVDAGRALHASDGVVEAPVCYQCSDPFPCPTIRALDPEAGGR